MHPSQLVVCVLGCGRGLGRGFFHCNWLDPMNFDLLTFILPTGVSTAAVKMARPNWQEGLTRKGLYYERVIDSEKILIVILSNIAKQLLVLLIQGDHERQT